MKEILIDGNGLELQAGDCVWSYDWGYVKVIGVLKKGTTVMGENDWYVSWEDGEETLLIDTTSLFKC
jgi:hypothetical protein